MNPLATILLMVAAFVVVFLESRLQLPRMLFGAQVDFLPPLIVYAALKCGMVTVALVAVWGGLCYDALSANPLGISVLALFLTGFGLHIGRDYLLRDSYYARFLIGLAASAAVPLLGWLVLLAIGVEPLWDAWSLWQWVVMGAVGGAVTPWVFDLFRRLEHAFSYPALPETSFRADREIKRDRKRDADF